MRKQILAAIMITGLCLTACSGENENNPNSEDNTASEAAQDNQNPTEDVSVSDEDVVEPEEISLSVEMNIIEPLEGYEGLYSCKYPIITADSDEYDALNNGLEIVNESVMTKAQNNVEDFKRWIDQSTDKSELPEDAYSIEISAEIPRSDTSIVSIVCLTHIEMDEYHPIYETDTYNINTSDGSILEIEDVIDLNNDFYEVVCNAIEDQYSDAELYDFVDLKTDIKNFFENEDEYKKKYNYKKMNFYISDKDIWFEFGGMEITDYYAGDTVVTVPIDDVRDYLKIPL